MDLGGRENVPIDAVGPPGVGSAWSHIPSRAGESPSACFLPEVSDVSVLGGRDGDSPPSPRPRDGPAGRPLEVVDDWLPWLLDPQHLDGDSGPHPPPSLPMPSPPPPPTHPTIPPPFVACAAVDGSCGDGQGGGRVPRPSAAGVMAAMPVDGEAAVDAAMAAAQAVLADVTAPTIEPLTAPSTPRSVNRAGRALSQRSMEWGVGALTISKRRAAIAAAGARKGRPRPNVAHPTDRRDDSSSSGGSGDSSSGLSTGGGGGGDGCSSHDTVDGDGNEDKSNPLVARLAAALADIPPTTSAAATRRRALACLAAVRAAAPDCGIGLPPVPTSAEREALRKVLNRRSADRSRQRLRQQATAVVAAVADKDSTIAVLRREVARLIADVIALQRQLAARQGAEGHPAVAA
ncbi:hypothetical protein MMPV_000137 [Pyropia vietnamensis]